MDDGNTDSQSLQHTNDADTNLDMGRVVQNSAMLTLTYQSDNYFLLTSTPSSSLSSFTTFLAENWNTRQ